MNLWYGLGAHAYISTEFFSAITRNLILSYFTENKVNHAFSFLQLTVEVCHIHTRKQTEPPLPLSMLLEVCRLASEISISLLYHLRLNSLCFNREAFIFTINQSIIKSIYEAP